MTDAATEYRLPEGSVDCHFHIYGPFDRFPYNDEGRFTPARPFTIENAFEIWEQIGVSRGVIVHAVGSGDDNAVTYDALRRFPDKLRATAILRPDISDRRLDELTDAGFKAVRITMIRQDGKPVSTKGTSYDDLLKLAPRIAERGWHAQLWIESSDLAAAAADLERLPLTYVIDHMSRTMADKGREHPDFVAFTERLKTGRYWVKISGADRNTRTGRPYADTAPYMKAIVAAASDQVVWGSDWPHVGHTTESMPRLQDLLRLFHECVPDEATRRKILIDNPTRLYNF
ncbi:MAG: amidohydrolase family protein [Ferrovibrio sp.]|uniref:amidohydrolase family protein n=1 Tax=Ferrovibrio sp. TaxID=1917215 RepID=UPI002602A685|nr:amidohydrolase family protein [Ferrovibrio sp.]MCW0235026.1 amidohydrolase family protein [Ferrovibrio sp.]